MFFFYQKTMTGKWSGRKEVYRPSLKGPEGNRRLPFMGERELTYEENFMSIAKLELKYPRIERTAEQTAALVPYINDLEGMTQAQMKDELDRVQAIIDRETEWAEALSVAMQA